MAGAGTAGVGVDPTTAAPSRLAPSPAVSSGSQRPPLQAPITLTVTAIVTHRMAIATRRTATATTRPTTPIRLTTAPMGPLTVGATEAAIGSPEDAATSTSGTRADGGSERHRRSVSVRAPAYKAAFLGTDGRRIGAERMDARAS